MSNSIDLNKLSEIFDFLSETEQGHKSLIELRKNFDTFKDQLPEGTSYSEFVYVLRALANQMPIEKPAEQDENLEFSDETKGLIFQKEPGKVKRLETDKSSSALNRVVPGGFIIKVEK